MKEIRKENEDRKEELKTLKELHGKSPSWGASAEIRVDGQQNLVSERSLRTTGRRDGWAMIERSQTRDWRVEVSFGQETTGGQKEEEDINEVIKEHVKEIIVAMNCFTRMKDWYLLEKSVEAVVIQNPTASPETVFTLLVMTLFVHYAGTWGLEVVFNEFIWSGALNGKRKN